MGSLVRRRRWLLLCNQEAELPRVRRLEAERIADMWRPWHGIVAGNSPRRGTRRFEVPGRSNRYADSAASSRDGWLGFRFGRLVCVYVDFASCICTLFHCRFTCIVLCIVEAPSGKLMSPLESICTHEIESSNGGACFLRHQ